MFILNLALGIALLFLGRKMFWLFVGGFGFLAASTLASRFLHAQAEWLVILLALGAGVVGALLAIFLQRLAIGLGGFLAGGYLVVAAMELIHFDAGGWTWLAFILGGVIGALLITGLFDWTLIFLSTFAGASLIIRALNLEFLYSALILVAASIIGVLVQSRLRKQEKDSS